jgi:cyclase
VKKKRIIPVVLFREGVVVQSKGFKEFKKLGDPAATLKRLSQWGSDEICFVDISPNKDWEPLRSDLGFQSDSSFMQTLERISTDSRMPLCCGGGIRTLQDVEDRIERGADKVLITSLVSEKPELIEEIVRNFGSQVLVAGIDVRNNEGNFEVMTRSGNSAIELNLSGYLEYVQNLGVGEIFLHSIDRDGMKNGFDLELINKITNEVSVPVIVCGGAGSWEHFAEVLIETNADGVAAANIFQHVDQSVYQAHRFLYNLGLPVRPPQLFEI